MDAGSDLEQPASADAGPGNLPVQLTRFIGRAADLAAVRSLVRGARLVTLTGSAGCGKTRLGLQAADGLAGAHADGAWLVELAGLGDPAQIAGSIAAALPVHRQGSFAEPAALAAAIGARDLIIVLDNCEHLIRGCAEVTERLLRGCPQIVILATSREPLGVPGEVTWRVPSLSFPPAGAAALTTGPADLADFEAVQLFVDRAGHARPGFELTGQNAAAVAEICARLDGIPLAIELAAAQLRVLPAAQIAYGLLDRLGLLAGGARTALPRQQTLEASIRWSYDLLAEPERQVLQCLSVCVGGFTLKAAEAIAADGTAEADRILDLVSQLADKSLILAGGEGSDGRFRMLESIRDYAARRLTESGATVRARQRHLDFFVDYARRRPGERDGHYRERLRSDYANLRQALEWAAERNDPRLLELATALVAYWSVSARLAEGRQWLQTAIARVTTGDAALRARALGGLAQVAGLAFDFPTAAAAGAESLAMLRELDDKPGMVLALTSLGFIAAPLAVPDSGRTYLAEAAALAGELGDDAAQAYALALIGRSAINHPDDRPAARDAARRGIELARRCGDVRAEGTAVCELGVLASLDGNPGEALPYLAEALPLLRTAGDAFFRSLCLVCTVHCLGLLGDAGRANTACAELDAITAELGTAALYYVHWARGWAAFCRGDWTEAIRAYRVELSYPGPVGLGGLPASVLAWSELYAGQSDQARQRMDDFLATHDPAKTCPALPLAIRALVARADGDSHLADEFAHRALLASPGDPFGQLAIWICLVATAVISGDLGHYELATRLASAVASFARAIGMVPLPAAADVLARLRRQCREALGDASFRRAETEGAGMSLSDAAAYASRGRGARRRPADGWDSLTPTELRVAAAVTEGLSNPQIAARMLITRRTVTTHLTSIYRKISVSTRAELAATFVHHQRKAEGSGTRGTD
jgi:predicted ATPase/DNA-binding CsgD family transcriptional regulator